MKKFEIEKTSISDKDFPFKFSIDSFNIEDDHSLPEELKSCSKWTPVGFLKYASICEYSDPGKEGFNKAILFTNLEEFKAIHKYTVWKMTPEVYKDRVDLQLKTIYDNNLGETILLVSKLYKPEEGQGRKLDSLRLDFIHKTNGIISTYNLESKIEENAPLLEKLDLQVLDIQVVQSADGNYILVQNKKFNQKDKYLGLFIRYFKEDGQYKLNPKGPIWLTDKTFEFTEIVNESVYMLISTGKNLLLFTHSNKNTIFSMRIVDLRDSKFEIDVDTRKTMSLKCMEKPIGPPESIYFNSKDLIL